MTYVRLVAEYALLHGSFGRGANVVMQLLKALKRDAGALLASASSRT